MSIEARIELDIEDCERLLGRIRERISVEDHEILCRMIESLRHLTQLLETKGTTIQKLRKLMFGPTSERLRDLPVANEAAEADGDAGQGDAAPIPANVSPEEPTPDSVGVVSDTDVDAEGDGNGNGNGDGNGDGNPKPGRGRSKKRKGHGRHGASAYTGGEEITHSHPTLSAGNACPCCASGRMYIHAEPKVLVRITGGPPLAAKFHKLERLRCNLCGKVFTTPMPEEIGPKKYDETAGAMIALMKYGAGTPFFRLHTLQRHMGIPLAPSTQWEIVNDVARTCEPAFDELVRTAAQCPVIHNDDTPMKVLKKSGSTRAEGAPEEGRTGTFTTNILAVDGQRQIALFFSGNRHAGENLEALLMKRDAHRDPPIQMCDALSRNLPKVLKTIVANCNTHGRRNFVDVVNSFPDQVKYVLEELGRVYQNDNEAKRLGLSPEERMAFHRKHSAMPMSRLKKWFITQIKQKLIEPNSGLGKAIAYMLRHWKKLVRFLLVPGAPLDNNVCERALKKAILHRKNSLFYKTERGAKVGDMLMSLIYSAELAGANPFRYLTALQKFASKVSMAPARWMPWNFEETLLEEGLAV